MWYATRPIITREMKRQFLSPAFQNEPNELILLHFNTEEMKTHFVDAASGSRPRLGDKLKFVRIQSDSTKKLHILWYAGLSGEGNNSTMDEKTFSAIAFGQIVGFPKCTEPINSFTLQH
jgi:hypothetical protein